MSAETTLKRQSKSILANENWAKSITGFLCVLSVLTLSFLIINFASCFLPENIEDNIYMLVVAGLVSLVALVCLIALSPIYTGYIRFIANCKDTTKGDIQDLFYYFSKGEYINAVQVNIFLMVRYALYIMLCSLPSSVMFYISTIVSEGIKTPLQICAVSFLLIGLLAFFFITRLFVMVQYLYVEDFNYFKESDLIKASKYIVSKNYGRVIKLYLSYILWGALCFFVIPIVFVYPYFKHTAVLSYSYMYELENKNPSSPYYNSNIKNESVNINQNYQQQEFENDIEASNINAEIKKDEVLTVLENQNNTVEEVNGENILK